MLLFFVNVDEVNIFLKIDKWFKQWDLNTKPFQQSSFMIRENTVFLGFFRRMGGGPYSSVIQYRTGLESKGRTIGHCRKAYCGSGKHPCYFKICYALDLTLGSQNICNMTDPRSCFLMSSFSLLNSSLGTRVHWEHWSTSLGSWKLNLSILLLNFSPPKLLMALGVGKDRIPIIFCISLFLPQFGCI